MAKRGRPVLGADLVDNVPGSLVAKKKLKAIVRTIADEWTIDEACGELGVNRSRFNALRGEFLAQASALLEPRQPGRRPALTTEQQEVAQEMQRLRDEVARLKTELHAHQIREELAIAMPFLLERQSPPDAPKAAGAAKKKTRPKRRGNAPGSSGRSPA